MSSSAASAYARVATTTASPRDIEAQTLLKAANKLQDAVNNADPFSEQTNAGADVQPQALDHLPERGDARHNPQPLDVRQKIANISVFVLSQTAALQMRPQLDHFRPLIEINRNIAAGLSGRPDGGSVMADIMSILSTAYKSNVLSNATRLVQIRPGRLHPLPGQLDRNLFRRQEILAPASRRSTGSAPRSTIQSAGASQNQAGSDQGLVVSLRAAPGFTLTAVRQGADQERRYQPRDRLELSRHRAVPRAAPDRQALRSVK